MALEDPCGRNDYMNSCEHVLYDDYYESWTCMEYCSGSEFHCKRCGWFVSECPCGCCNGASKISLKAWRAIERRQKQRRNKIANTIDI